MSYMLYFHHFPYLLQKYTSGDLKSTNFSSCLPVNYVFFVKNFYFFNILYFCMFVNKQFAYRKSQKLKAIMM